MRKGIILFLSLYFILVGDTKRIAVIRSVPLYRQGELLVKFKGPRDYGVSRIFAFGDTPTGSFKVGNGYIYLVRLWRGKSVEEAIGDYLSDVNVEYAEPNYYYYANATIEPNDVYYSSQWGLKAIEVNRAWEHITDCSSVNVAIIDSGINYDHEDLKGNMWDGSLSCVDENGDPIIGGCPNHGWDFVDGDSDPMDYYGHGTHVAGIVGSLGNNSIGTTGVCWSVKLMAVRVLDEVGSGTTDSIIKGILFAVNNGAQVINLSFGGSGYSRALEDAIGYGISKGAVFIAAAGNSGSNNDLYPVYPCNYDFFELICVAAVDSNSLASFSNYGRISVDVGAPGVDIYSTYYGDEMSLSLSSITWNENNVSGVQTWETSSTTCSGSSLSQIRFPDNFCTSYYGEGEEDEFYSDIAIGVQYDFVKLSFSIYSKMYNSGDYVETRYSYSTGPLGTGGNLLYSLAGNNTEVEDFKHFILNDCFNQSNCTISFRFVSDSIDGGDSDVGVVVFDLLVDAVDFDSYVYKGLSGTSMAAPFVSGIAAMLKAFNPMYNPWDIAYNIRNSGIKKFYLLNKTSTGRLVDADRAIKYINKIKGVRVKF